MDALCGDDGTQRVIGAEIFESALGVGQRQWLGNDSDPMPIPMTSLQKMSNAMSDMDPLAPVEAVAKPKEAAMVTRSSIPYVFLRPYRSARNPKTTCPIIEPTKVAMFIPSAYLVGKLPSQ